MIELTKEEAIHRHRMLWNWIADETLRQKRLKTFSVRRMIIPEDTVSLRNT